MKINDTNIDKESFEGMNPRDKAAFQAAIDSGAVEYKPYDKRPALKQIEKLLKAYIQIPDEALDNADEEFEDTNFDTVWNETKDLLTRDSKARAMLYKVLKASPDMSELLDSYAAENEWELPKDNPDFNDELDDDSYTFVWEDSDPEENTKIAEEAKKEFEEKEPEEKEDVSRETNDKEESWGNLAKTLKDKHI